MVQIIKEKDEKKFAKIIEAVLKEYPLAEIQYSASLGTGIGGGVLQFTALVIVR